MTTRSAVALIVFNRPEVTARTFKEIAKARPQKLFVIGDGPRPGRDDDIEHCKAVREITEGVDWPCEVFWNFSSRNLGCGARVVSGLNWLFQHVDQAIILEDDCVPSRSFFAYCDEMLERYAKDERVMMVSGNNFVASDYDMQDSYTFFRCLNLWGWATWKRAWERLDHDMNVWPQMRRHRQLEKLFQRRDIAEHWKQVFDRYYVKSGKRNVWDYQFTCSVFAHDGLGIAPCVNLVSNIGFGPDATHTFDENKLANRPVHELAFPLKHPEAVRYDARYDGRTFDEVFRKIRTPRRRKLRARIRSWFPLEMQRWWVSRSHR